MYTLLPFLTIHNNHFVARYIIHIFHSCKVCKSLPQRNNFTCPKCLSCNMHTQDNPATSEGHATAIIMVRSAAHTHSALCSRMQDIMGEGEVHVKIDLAFLI